MPAVPLVPPLRPFVSSSSTDPEQAGAKKVTETTLARRVLSGRKFNLERLHAVLISNHRLAAERALGSCDESPRPEIERDTAERATRGL
jgi:hypothetical protein